MVCDAVLRSRLRVSPISGYPYLGLQFESHLPEKPPTASYTFKQLLAVGDFPGKCDSNYNPRFPSSLPPSLPLSLLRLMMVKFYLLGILIIAILIYAVNDIVNRENICC